MAFRFKFLKTNRYRGGDLEFDGESGDPIDDDQARTMAMIALADAMEVLAGSLDRLSEAVKEIARRPSWQE